MVCQHEVVLVNRTTKKVVCHSCLAELEYSCLASLQQPQAQAQPQEATELAALEAETIACAHIMVQTNPSTGVKRCIGCDELVEGPAALSAHATAIPSFKETSFAGLAGGGTIGYSYGDAYNGEYYENWDPASGKPCPHFIKTTNMSTGKVTCCMCHIDLV